MSLKTDPTLPVFKSFDKYLDAARSMGGEIIADVDLNATLTSGSLTIRRYDMTAQNDLIR
jgi:hypothetical protein